MATIKTVKPAGGGDYTTLAAWWNAAKDVSADQWAECYGGGDLGRFPDWMLGVADDATHFSKVYAADGESPWLTGESGTYNAIACQKDYAQISGLLVKDFGNAGQGISMTGANSLVEKCTVDAGIGTVSWGIESVGLVRNCLVKNCDFYGIGTGNGGTFQNCAVINCGKGYSNPGVVSFAGTMNLFNVVAVDNYTDFGVSGGSLVCDHCASSDATADDFGGSGNIVNIVPADCFTDPTNGDLTLKSGSPLIDAGADLSASFTDDILGNTRPSFGAFDIGAFEKQYNHPAEAAVRSGVNYGGGVAADVADVRSGVSYGWEDSPVTGTLTLPAASKVVNGIQYGADGTELTGTCQLPAESDVRDGVGYGASGTEYEGELGGGTVTITIP